MSMTLQRIFDIFGCIQKNIQKNIYRALLILLEFKLRFDVSKFLLLSNHFATVNENMVFKDTLSIIHIQILQYDCIVFSDSSKKELCVFDVEYLIRD